MRDPKRIGRMLKLLEQYWQNFPDMRLGQTIINLAGMLGISGDIYNVEDDVWEKELHKLVKKLKLSEVEKL